MVGIRIKATLRNERRRRNRIHGRSRDFPKGKKNQRLEGKENPFIYEEEEEEGNANKESVEGGKVGLVKYLRADFAFEKRYL